MEKENKKSSDLKKATTTTELNNNTENEKKQETKTRVAKNAEGYGYKYTNLAQIHEYLEEQGIKYYQEIITEEGADFIYTIPIINGEEMKARRGVRLVEAVLQGTKNPAQEQGSAITYARRYSLLLAFGLATEDDDGASLSQNRTTATRKSAKSSENLKGQVRKLYTNEEIARFFKKTPEEADNLINNMSDNIATVLVHRKTGGQ